MMQRLWYGVLMVLLSMCGIVYGQALDRTHVNYTNPLQYGATCDATTFNGAITAISTTKTTLFITRTDRAKVNCTWTLASNITTNINTTIYIPSGVVVSPNVGVTVTFNGPVLIDNIASLAGAGSYVFNYPQENIISPIANTGCLTSVPAASLTIPTMSCNVNMTVGNRVLTVDQPTNTIGPLGGGDGTYWTAIDFSTVRAVAGWTRVGATHYLYQLSASKPTEVTGIAIIQRVTVAGGVITAIVSTISREIIVPQTISVNTSIDNVATWTWKGDGKVVTVASGITLTLASCPNAGRWKIFEADGSSTGTVLLTQAKCREVYLEWWGADNTGVATDTQVSVNRAVAALPSGGVITGAGGSAHYKFSAAPTNIATSYITLDYKGSLLTSTASFSVATLGIEPPASGNYSTVVYNSHFKNARIGSANDSSNLLRPPQMIWCNGCSVQGIHKKGLSTTTAMTTRVCQDCLIRDVTLEGGDGTGFGILLHMSNNTLVDNYKLVDCNCVYGLQVKGGVDNLIVNSSIQRMVGAGVDEGFRDRGDAPYGASGTSGVKYPFATLGVNDCTAVDCWAIADPRRQSINSRYVNCSVVASPDVTAFITREAIGTIFSNVSADDVLIGAAFTKHISGTERDFTLNNFNFTNVGVTAAGTAAGIFVEADDASNFHDNVKISNGQVHTTQVQGIRLTYTKDTKISNVHIVNPGEGGSTAYGIESRLANTNPSFTNNVIEDVRGTSKMTDGIRVSTATTTPTIVNNTMRCTNCAATWFPVQSWVLGTYSGNYPALVTDLTTNGTASNARQRFTFPSGAVARICVEATAKDGTTNAAFYRECAVYRDVAGTVSIVGSAYDVQDQETDSSWGGVSFTTATNVVRVNVTGLAATTISWLINATVMIME